MKVSVIIPTYNRRDMVRQAIETVLAQTFTDYELIVIDDGSTDGTQQALADLSDQIQYIWQENQGESVARNRGIEVARGEYIALLDSDDLWEPEKLVEQVAVLDNDSTTIMVGCASRIINKQGEFVSNNISGIIADSQQLTYEALRYHNHFFGGGSTALFRRVTVEQIGAFVPELRYGEEWDLWIRLAQKGAIKVIPQPLACIRQHSDTQTRDMTPEAIDRRLADYTAILKQNPPLDGSEIDPAMAKQYLRAAVDDAAISRLTLAQERLIESARWDKGYVIKEEGVTLIISRAAAIAAPTFEPTPEVLAFFEAALACLTHVEPFSTSATKASYCQLYLALAGMARTKQNWGVVRRCLWLSLTHDPLAWRKPGFAGGLVESLFGPSFLNWLRVRLGGQQTGGA